VNSKAGFALKGRNPDVLTSIANLSNDEVFTPPDFASRMLDLLSEHWSGVNNGAIIWEDMDVTFIDPFTKSGVFLREISSRLIQGLEKKIPDLQTRVNHVLKNQVFGIAITELTSYLARRSVYCSKIANGVHSICSTFDNPQGNIWFERQNHTWVSGKCKFCGANRKDYDRESLESYAYPILHDENLNQLVEKAFGKKMKFDVVIGNPPYQLGQSGGESVGGFAMPIYQKFIEAAKGLDPRYITMVTPSRWFAGGRGLEEFRAQMLSDKRLSALVDYPNSAEVFPGVDIKGGVSYFLWDASSDGECEVTTVVAGEVGTKSKRHLDSYDVLIRRNEAIPILEKVLAKSAKMGLKFLSEDVSPIQPFSIRTNYRGKPSASGIKEPVLLYQNGGTSFIAKSEIPRNVEWVPMWKVLLAGASGSGNDPQVLGRPIVTEPNSACTETYLVAGRFDTEIEARNLDAYLRTRFARFLVSLRKYTQHIYNERFAFVPKVDFSKHWDDSSLYKEFGLNVSDIKFIEAMVTPMEPSDGAN
jgi:site-specific DNA-methyltransferase (adenine-specific)